MKICIIGNSHTACLKAAWDNLHALHPEHTLTFFAGPGLSMADMTLDAPNRQLIPLNGTLADALRTTSGGLDAIAIDDYDAFLLLALGFNFAPVSPWLSQAVTTALMGDSYRDSINAALARMIRACSSKPIHVGSVPRRTLPAPMRSTASLTMGEVARLCDQVHLDDHFHFIPQPSSTLEDLIRHKPQPAPE